MKNLMRWGLSGLVVILLVVVPALAQDQLTLTPFTDDNYGISGVAPDGWTIAGPGALARNKNANDVTVIVQQTLPLGPDAVMKALMPQLLLQSVPDSVGTRTTDALTWTLYKVDVRADTITVSVDFALAAGDGKTYVVFLQTSPDEYDSLHDSLFLPLLDALKPLTAPVEAVPYVQEDVTFPNGDITLAGTLTLPEGDGPFSAIVLVTGSGPQDRDESVAPLATIKAFRLIADALTRAGMVVLRYDDRGVGKSTGDFATATIADFATDASAAIDYLLTRHEINPSQIGLLGHSEGSMVAAMLGASNPHLKFIVSTAGPAVSGGDVLVTQYERTYKAENASDADLKAQLNFLSQLFPLIRANKGDGIRQLMHDLVMEKIKQLPEDQQKQIGDLEAYASQQAATVEKTYNTAYWRFALTYNPGDDWAKTNIPVLAIYGTLDVQVDADQNSTALDAALKKAGNRDYQITILPGANHLMQAATTGSTTEYATLKQEFTPDFLPTIIDWLAKHVALKAAS
jgi:uncharacterized protein